MTGKSIACKNHPEIRADVTCGRCGDFVCLACAPEALSQVCPECRDDGDTVAPNLSIRIRLEGVGMGSFATTLLVFIVGALVQVSMGLSGRDFPLHICMGAGVLPLSVFLGAFAVFRVDRCLRWSGEAFLLRRREKFKIYMQHSGLVAIVLAGFMFLMAASDGQVTLGAQLALLAGLSSFLVVFLASVSSVEFVLFRLKAAYGLLLD